MIGNIRCTYSPKEDSVVFLQDLDVIFRNVTAGLLVSIRGPVKIGEFVSCVAEFLGNSMNDLDSGVDHFGTDTICSYLSNLVYTLPLGYMNLKPVSRY
jgi:hypothetical protein